MKKAEVYNVKGIMCPRCVQALKAHLAETECINEISVSDDYEQVTVSFEDDIISTEEIKKKIETVPDKDFKVMGIAES